MLKQCINHTLLTCITLKVFDKDEDRIRELWVKAATQEVSQLDKINVLYMYLIVCYLIMYGHHIILLYSTVLFCTLTFVAETGAETGL